MSDIASRMAKQVKDKKPSSGKAEPFQEAPKKYPHRVTLDLSAEDYATLRQRAFEEHIGMAAMLRGMVQLYIDDPELSAKVKKLEH